MKPATSISLMLAEGPNHLCGKTVVITEDVWAGAEAQLREWSYSAPHSRDQLGGSKTDFTVTYEDGETYSGTFFLQQDDTDLPSHIRAHLQHVIDHREHYTHLDVDEYVTFLDTYEIGASK